IQTDLSGYYRFADPLGDELFAANETHPAHAEYDDELYSQLDDDEPEPAAPNSVDTEHAMAFFGATLGFFGPLTLLLTLFLLGGVTPISIVAAIFGSGVIFVTSITGWFSGKQVGRLVRKTEEVPLPFMIFVALMIGLYWGVFTGVVGGILILVYGAIWGGLVGGLAGALAVPPFILLHRYLKTGVRIERGKLLPITFGIIGSLCAFVLGA